jgi:tetratricopeptide (TPR) repeat protein
MTAWMDRELPGAELPTLARARALASMCDLARQLGALAEARACLDESLTLSRNAGDPRSIIAALNSLGALRIRENDHDAAGACFEEALRLARELGEGALIGQGLNNARVDQGLIDFRLGVIPFKLSALRDFSFTSAV